MISIDKSIFKSLFFNQNVLRTWATNILQALLFSVYHEVIIFLAW